ncbi:THO complex subunit 5 [Plasmodiophora brassicae]|uniref:Uncharacterized protein n=2 Tax=Plasmodiophora brassicae TaxID=37360 RepID=A0A3P3YCE3_PLABS|nr:unnamed protein product [Plasmodiophora brassicae]
MKMDVDGEEPGVPGLSRLIEIVDELKRCAVSAVSLGAVGDLDLDERCWHLRMLLAELKQVNREVNVHMEELTNSTSKKKVSLDAATLNYQSLLREKAYVLKETAICKEFAHTRPDVVLVGRDEFMRSAPAHLKEPDILGDEHRLHIARLMFEKQQRAELVERLKAMNAQKQRLIASNREKRAFLDSISDHLANVFAACVPLKARLGLSDAFSVPSPEVMHLPDPLRMLYMSLASYKVVFNDQLVAVHVNEKRRETFVVKGGNGKEEVECTWAPNSVVLSVQASSKLPGVDIVFSLLTPGPVAFVQSSSDTLQLLSGLFPSDDGECMPGGIASVLCSSIDSAKLGRPFRWAQRLCGLHFVAGTESAQDDGVTVRRFISLLREQIVSQAALIEQIAQIQKCKNSIPLPPGIAARYCLRPRSSLLSLSTKPGHTRSLTAVFSLDSQITMTAQIAVAGDHPRSAPRVSVSIDVDQDPYRESEFLAASRLIEHEVSDCGGMAGEEAYQRVLLPAVLRQLQMCFDIACIAIVPELCGMGDEKVFVRARRGRDRRLPFVYDPDLTCFRHRFLE